MDNLTALFQEMWRQGEFPQDFKDAPTIHIYKRKGNRQIRGKHQGISLLNTSDMIFAVCQLQEKCQEMRTHIYSAFVDLTKAFDTVNRERPCTRTASTIVSPSTPPSPPTQSTNADRPPGPPLSSSSNSTTSASATLASAMFIKVKHNFGTPKNTNTTTINTSEAYLVYTCPHCDLTFTLHISLASTTRVGCPRPQCQRVITLPGASSDALGPSNLENVPINGGTFTQRNVAIRLTCGNCHRPFSIPSPQNSYSNTRTCADRLIYCLSGGSAPNSNFLIAARCPQCRKVTSVGPAYSRVRWVSYLLLTLIFLIISIAVTIGTVNAALVNGALYFLWSVLYLLVVIFAVRGIIFFRMSVSALEVSVAHA
ncbi:phosphatidylinositol-4,5-bisphosphate 4-phosphatase activity [Sparganum proliferum]